MCFLFVKQNWVLVKIFPIGKLGVRKCCILCCSKPCKSCLRPVSQRPPFPQSGDRGLWARCVFARPLSLLSKLATKMLSLLLQLRGAMDWDDVLVCLLGKIIVPVAIKYNLNITDAFWNSKKTSFPGHLFHLMTSWALVADVTYLEPQHKRPTETSSHFAARVKEMIAELVILSFCPPPGSRSQSVDGSCSWDLPGWSLEMLTVWWDNSCYLTCFVHGFAFDAQGSRSQKRALGWLLQVLPTEGEFLFWRGFSSSLLAFLAVSHQHLHICIYKYIKIYLQVLCIYVYILTEL